MKLPVPLQIVKVKALFKKDPVVRLAVVLPSGDRKLLICVERGKGLDFKRWRGWFEELGGEPYVCWRNEVSDECREQILPKDKVTLERTS